VNGGEAWSWARECLYRHGWDPIEHERERSTSSRRLEAVDEIVKIGWLHRHGLIDGIGLTAEEVCAWIRRISRGAATPSQEQTQAALDGLVRIEAASVREVDGRNRFRARKG
jgi:hypothetical protein